MVICRVEMQRSFGSLPTALPGYAITNLLFAIAILLCAYNFFRAITLDPGVVVSLRDGELKEVGARELHHRGSELNLARADHRRARGEWIIQLDELLLDLFGTFSGPLELGRMLTPHPRQTRRPLRSKHSHVTKRCVARFDQ